MYNSYAETLFTGGFYHEEKYRTETCALPYADNGDRSYERRCTDMDTCRTPWYNRSRPRNGQPCCIKLLANEREEST